METLKRKSTILATVALILGIGLGLGIGTWTHRSEAAGSGSPEKATVTKTEENRKPLAQKEDWDPMREMQRMHDEIDQAIRHATEQFRMDGVLTPFSHDLGYSSSLDVRDRKDHFEVRAYLPDAVTKDVKVTTEGDQTLRVSVSHRKEQKKDANGQQEMWSEMGQYDQLVTLPGPANMNEMKVDTRENEVVITIPKAKAS